jgi:large subunit ribosomal protein L19e
LGSKGNLYKNKKVLIEAIHKERNEKIRLEKIENEQKQRRMKNLEQRRKKLESKLAKAKAVAE